MALIKLSSYPRLVDGSRTTSQILTERAIAEDMSVVKGDVRASLRKAMIEAILAFCKDGKRLDANRNEDMIASHCQAIVETSRGALV